MRRPSTEEKIMFKSTLTICATLAALSVMNPILAQQSAPVSQAQPIKRIPLQKFDIPGANYETVIGIAEIAPNEMIGRHRHPGPEAGGRGGGRGGRRSEGQAPR